jgi:predicted nucleotidyltransferase
VTLKGLSRYEATKLTKAVVFIAKEAQEQGVRVALCGGLAMQHYGSDRLTKDVDVFVARPLMLTDTSPLAFDGERCGETYCAAGGVDIDMLQVDAIDSYEKLYTEALDHAVQVVGLPLKIVRPEYMVAIKMIAQRDKDNLDLDYLLMRVPLDIPKVRDILKRTLGSHMRKAFDNLWLEAEWKKERMRRDR